MPKVAIDHEEAFRFAAFLDSASAALKEKKGGIASAFDQLHDVWRDDKYRQFEQVFADAMRDVDRFLEMSDTYAAFVRRKAERAREYLEQRY